MNANCSQKEVKEAKDTLKGAKAGTPYEKCRSQNGPGENIFWRRYKALLGVIGRYGWLMVAQDLDLSPERVPDLLHCYPHRTGFKNDAGYRRIQAD